MFSLKGKSKKLIILVMVLLLVSGGAATWLVIKNKNAVSSEEIDSFITQVEQIEDQQDFKKVESTIKNYLDKHKNLKPEYKHRLIYILAGNYINLKDFKSALGTFQEAEKINPSGLNYLTALSIAQTAQAVGDNRLAIEYYKKTIELARTSDNSVHSTFIPQYEKTIKILENPNDPTLKQGDAPAGYPIDGNFPQAPR